MFFYVFYGFFMVLSGVNDAIFLLCATALSLQLGYVNVTWCPVMAFRALAMWGLANNGRGRTETNKVGHRCWVKNVKMIWIIHQDSFCWVAHARISISCFWKIWIPSSSPIIFRYAPFRFSEALKLLRVWCFWMAFHFSCSTKYALLRNNKAPVKQLR